MQFVCLHDCTHACMHDSKKIMHEMCPHPANLPVLHRCLLVVLVVHPAVSAFVPALTAEQNCSKAFLFDTDLCGGDPGYRTTEVPDGEAAASHCAALCCAQSNFCRAWVTRPVSVMSDNCRAGTTCCWAKPQCNRAKCGTAYSQLQVVNRY